MHAHSRQPMLFAALRQSLRGGYALADLRADLWAGVTVGIVAVPLSMALAIASGVPPQHGLYTAIVAGALIALTGGARHSVSGPTAAFVVILLPITHQYGLGGLLITTMMAGVILVAMGLAGLGRLIQFIPYPVTTGFTAGIAVVIATLQFKDLLGLEVLEMPAAYLEKLAAIFGALPTAHIGDMLVGGGTLLVMVWWQRRRSRLPAPLMALAAGTLLAWLMTRLWGDLPLATIGSQFHWSIGGDSGTGIPPYPPLPLLPWSLPDASGQPVGLSWTLLRELLPSAFAVAMLGAIESLLCAVVADGMTGCRHNPNAELVGQGLGNIVGPFLGAMTATAAISRTATNIRSGARSPVASLIQAMVVLLAVLSLAPVLAWVPMAALAALLIVVAWNMSEAKHFAHMVKVAPRSDVAVLLTCFGLTVIFDMVIAVAVGVVLASVLFIHRMTQLTGTQLISATEHGHLIELPPEISLYEVNGPLFFGAAEKAMSALYRVNNRVQVVILDMDDVPVMDMTGIVALASLVKTLQRKQLNLIIANLRPNIGEKLRKAGLADQPGLKFANSLAEAQAMARAQVQPGNGGSSGEINPRPDCP